mgnify:FL=1|jgi:UPF0755 protein
MAKPSSPKHRKAAPPNKRPILALLMVIAGGFALLTLMVWQALYRPLPMANERQILRITEGETYSGLIRELAEQDQIRLPIFAKLYQRLFIHKQLKAGVYQLEAGLDIREMMQRLSDGRMAQMVRITVIEGTTFAQLQQKLASNDGVTQTLIGLSGAALMRELGSNKTYPEGWFAPDTYYFAQGETDKNILKLLLDKQAKILAEEWAGRAQGLPYQSPEEALIMASIVEKETGIGSERADVAAVFVNRLRIGMRLQTDPTVIYGMGERYNGNITKKDLLTPTPYNTYTINGLPPTPIALPSRAAIHAALHPSSSKALYFVATGTGGHVFSHTLAEHNAAVARYLAVLRQKRQAQTLSE